MIAESKLDLFLTQKKIIYDIIMSEQLKTKKKKKKSSSRVLKSSSTVQAVVFGKNWTTKKARQWLKEKKWKPIKRVHITSGGFLRYRLRDPKQYKKFIWKSTNKGINLIIGFTRI